MDAISQTQTLPGHDELPRSEQLRGQLRDMERQLDQLQGLAARCVEEHGEALRARQAAREYLELAPLASARLETLTRQLFGELLDEIEATLTHGIREILGQDRRVTSLREVKNNRLSIEFQVESPEGVEDILRGQGGSVCNILSVGLRLIGLSCLDPAGHRPFLVLDEQDCWLRPDLVPRLMKLVARIADKLGVQVLVISHHPIDAFSTHADRIYHLKPHRELGVLVERYDPKSAPNER